MTQAQPTHRPKWFLVVSILALIWNMLGLMAFISHVMMTPEMIAELPEPQQALYLDVPIWATVAFAVAVLAGTSGCIFLVLKKAFANMLFIASLVGILVQDYYAFVVVDSIGILGLSSLTMPLTVLTIAIALILLTSKAEQKYWLQ